MEFRIFSIQPIEQWSQPYYPCCKIRDNKVKEIQCKCLSPHVANGDMVEKLCYREILNSLSPCGKYLMK